MYTGFGVVSGQGQEEEGVEEEEEQQQEEKDFDWYIYTKGETVYFLCVISTICMKVIFPPTILCIGTAYAYVFTLVFQETVCGFHFSTIFSPPF